MIHPPTTDEVVEAWRDRLRTEHVSAMHEFNVTERLYLQPVLFYDMDIDWAALIRVLWHEGEHPDRPTVVQYLGIYRQSYSGDEVIHTEWHDDRRLFFDAKHGREITEWWTKWFFDIIDADDRWASPSLLAHNVGVERADRDRARRIGLDLPYLAEQDVPCKHCRLPLHKADNPRHDIWVDDTDGDCCMGDDNLVNENLSHEPDLTV